MGLISINTATPTLECEEIGVAAATLAGAPTAMLAGSLQDLRMSDAVILDESVLTRLSFDPKVPLKVGDTFEMNDRRARIVGVAETRQMSGGTAGSVFITFDRATQYAPGQRKMLTFVLAAPSLQEVEDALVDYATERVRHEALRERVASTVRAVELAGELFRNGLTAFLNVLNARRSQYQAEDLLAQSTQAVSTNLVAYAKPSGAAGGPSPYPRLSVPWP
jgi:hypothetical protein